MGSVKCCCFLLMCMKGKRKGLVELKSSYSVLGKRERDRDRDRESWLVQRVVEGGVYVAGAQLK